MNHANKTTGPICFIIFNRDKSKYAKMLRMDGDEDPVNHSRSGHWKWLTRGEACDSGQPCLPRLAEKQARPPQKNSADIADVISRFMRVQALWGGAWASHFRMLLGIQRGNGHLFKVAVVPALIVTHHDLRPHFAAR